MHIPIIPIIQKTPKTGCAYACLRMVLVYHGVHVTDAEISNFVIKDQNDATYSTELARFAVQRGLRAECFAYNLYFTDPQDAKLSKEKLLAKITEEKNKPHFDVWYQELIQSTILCIEQGVDYRIHKPSFQMISHYLNEGVPLIASVSYAALYNRKADPFAGHDIVLHGIEGDIVYFIDPEHGKEESTSIDNLMFAITSRKAIAASSYLLAVTNPG